MEKTVPGKYSLCSHFDGEADARSRLTFTCDNIAKESHIGRYLIIQIVSRPGVRNDVLTLCEVSVFAGNNYMFVKNLLI